LDHSFSQCNRRNPPVVVVQIMGDLIFLTYAQHIFGLLSIHGHRFFAENMLPRTSGGKGNLVMEVLRRGNVNDVNIIALNNFPPVGSDLLPAPFGCKRGQITFMAATSDFQYRLYRGVEKQGGFQPRITMRPAHELITDDAYIYRFHD